MKNPLYIRLHAGFGEWLRILNFDHTSQLDMPVMLKAFLIFLKENDCNSITGITESYLENYLHYLREKPCKTKPGILSLNYIRKHLQVIRKFARYLAESGQVSFAVKVKIKGKASNIKSILTKKEVARLYEATTESCTGAKRQGIIDAVLWLCFEEKRGFKLKY